MIFSLMNYKLGNHRPAVRFLIDRDCYDKSYAENDTDPYERGDLDALQKIVDAVEKKAVLTAVDHPEEEAD
ncbi:MAG: hypothetical protein ACI8XO_003421 [Verrucomicrobiales bacterium]|jgi:hypothetical protein